MKNCYMAMDSVVMLFWRVACATDAVGMLFDEATQRYRRVRGALTRCLVVKSVVKSSLLQATETMIELRPRMLSSREKLTVIKLIPFPLPPTFARETEISLPRRLICERLSAPVVPAGL